MKSSVRVTQFALMSFPSSNQGVDFLAKLGAFTIINHQDARTIAVRSLAINDYDKTVKIF